MATRQLRLEEVQPWIAGSVRAVPLPRASKLLAASFDGTMQGPICLLACPKKPS